MSDSAIIALSYFVLGTGVGVLASMITAAVMLRRIMKTPIAAEQVPQLPELNEEVKRRLMKASELTGYQNDIMSQVQTPSVNALHSKHKHGLMAQWKQLEEEKIAVLQSIVRDGHDPIITVFNSVTNASEEIPLSKFLISADEDAKQPVHGTPAKKNNVEGPPGTIRKVERNGKTFFVIEGGKKLPNQ